MKMLADLGSCKRTVLMSRVSELVHSTRTRLDLLRFFVCLHFLNSPLGKGTQS